MYEFVFVKSRKRESHVVVAIIIATVVIVIIFIIFIIVIIVCVPRSGASRTTGWKDGYLLRLAHCPHSSRCELWVLPIDKWPRMPYPVICWLVASNSMYLFFLPTLLSILSPFPSNFENTFNSARMTGFFYGETMTGTCQGTNFRGEFLLVWEGRL